MGLGGCWGGTPLPWAPCRDGPPMGPGVRLRGVGWGSVLRRNMGSARAARRGGSGVNVRLLGAMSRAASGGALRPIIAFMLIRCSVENAEG